MDKYQAVYYFSEISFAGHRSHFDYTSPHIGNALLQNVWVCVCVYWSLLYSAILCSWADSLRSHVILHELIAFYSTFLNIHHSCLLTALARLVPQETAAILACSVCTIQQRRLCLLHNLARAAQSMGLRKPCPWTTWPQPWPTFDTKHVQHCSISMNTHPQAFALVLRQVTQFLHFDLVRLTCTGTRHAIIHKSGHLQNNLHLPSEHNSPELIRTDITVQAHDTPYHHSQEWTSAK